MRRTKWLQETRRMRFEEAYDRRRDQPPDPGSSGAAWGCVNAPFAGTSTATGTRGWRISVWSKSRTTERRWTKCWRWRPCIGSATTAGTFSASSDIFGRSLYPGETAASGRWSGEDGQAQGPSPAAPGTGPWPGCCSIRMAPPTVG